MTYRSHSDETWSRARRDYLAGMSATEVCARYDMGRSTFRARAAEEGWRRADADDPEPPDDDAADLMAEPKLDLTGLAEQALRRSARAVASGRASEAARCLRLHRDYLGLVAAEADRYQRLRQGACEEARQAADAMAAIARLRAAGGDAQPVIDALRQGHQSDTLDGLDHRAAPLSRLDCERLTKARDKALRRGQATRAAELQARLDEAQPP